ncbi:putative nuclease HARBI1 [Teleopsis dalmanni]|uniref:putative nuclease HARBI1 n=1 Tax=Teleopsis dalmanni TaxID=139649 RepID=UPI0018CFE677|nr:putative nuclease HARBI1 [Teleopsis dalmanni]
MNLLQYHLLIDMDTNIFNYFLQDMEDLELFDEFLEMKWLQHIPKHAERYVMRKIKKRFNPLIDLPEEEFQAKYHFTKDNMRRIIEMIRDDLEIDNYSETRSNQVPVELQIMAAIRYWSLSEHPEITALAHGVSKRILNKISRRVAIALASKASRYIRMPATLAEKELITSAFHELAQMPQVIGAVTHSSLRFQRNEAYETTHNNSDPSEGLIHIQIVSDTSFKIRDLDCKMIDSNYTNNTNEFFSQTRIKERFEQNEFRGRILLGDNRLMCTSCLFTPVEFPTVPEEQSFNRAHAITYAVATNCLSLWKRRFGVLGSEICSSYNTAKHLIIALALLHNMAIDWNDNSFEHMFNGYCNGDYSVSSSPLSITSSRSEDLQTRQEFIKNNF